MGAEKNSDAARAKFDLLMRLIVAEPSVSLVRLSAHCCEGGVTGVTFLAEGYVGRVSTKIKNDLTELAPQELDLMLREAEERRYSGTMSLTALCAEGRVYKIRKGLESSVR